MQLLCIKYEHSHIQKQCLIRLNISNIEYIQISFKLTVTWNSCNCFYKPMKIGFRTKFA